MFILRFMQLVKKRVCVAEFRIRSSQISMVYEMSVAQFVNALIRLVLYALFEFIFGT